MAYPLIWFTVLAYGITWLAVLPLVLDELAVLPFHVSPFLHALGAAGPITAAFLLRRSEDPRTQVQDLYSRASGSGLRPGWVTVCALSPFILTSVAVLILKVSGSEPDLSNLWLTTRSPAWLLDVAIAALLYGFGEEAGWRGYLLPRLQTCHGAIVSTLILAVIWAVWHAPFFVYRFDITGPFMVVGFFIGLLAGAFWLTFMFNSTGGSVIAVSLWHASWNLVNLALAEVSTSAVALLNGLMMVLGYGSALIWARRGLAVEDNSRRASERRPGRG